MVEQIVQTIKHANAMDLMTWVWIIVVLLALVCTGLRKL